MLFKEELTLKEEKQMLKEEKPALQGGALALPGSKLKEVEILSGKRLLIYFQFLNISLVFTQTR